MRQQKIILDTGPWVAFFNAKDQYHAWILNQISKLNPPFLTSEAVVPEASFLLKHCKNGASNILELIERELLLIPFRLEEEFN